MKINEISLPKITEDINGITDYRNLIHLVESAATNESIDQNDKLYLSGIESDPPIIGEQYSIVMVICLPKSQVTIHGSYAPVTLEKMFVENGLNICQFSNGKRYPEERDSALSYTKLFLFKQVADLQNCLSAVALKFKTTTNIYEITRIYN